jgi:hypothetical protein
MRRDTNGPARVHVAIRLSSCSLSSVIVKESDFSSYGGRDEMVAEYSKSGDLGTDCGRSLPLRRPVVRNAHIHLIFNGRAQRTSPTAARKEKKRKKKKVVSDPHTY